MGMTDAHQPNEQNRPPAAYSPIFKTRRTFSHHLQFQKSLNYVELPQELIIEILVRLPVISLLKFKCVCKSWLSLISSPHFIRSHFSLSSKADPYLNSHLLIITLIPLIPCIKKLSLYSALSEPSTHASNIAYSSRNPSQCPRIHGIVNGLVCLDIENVFYIWNPALRKSKCLPLPNFTMKRHFCISVSGFGYDASNDDYKVFFRGPGYEYYIYSLQTSSWRRIEDLKGLIPWGSGYYANGKIYWEDGSSSSEKGWNLLSLDMASEEYEKVQPPYFEANNTPIMAYGELRGKLYALYEYKFKKTELWVMEECWSKVFSIPYDKVHRADRMGRLLCILRNGEIVSSDQYRLLVHHINGKEFRSSDMLSDVCKFCLYVETLVSPYGSGIAK